MAQVVMDLAAKPPLNGILDERLSSSRIEQQQLACGRSVKTMNAYSTRSKKPERRVLVAQLEGEIPDWARSAGNTPVSCLCLSSRTTTAPPGLLIPGRKRLK